MNCFQCFPNSIQESQISINSHTRILSMHSKTNQKTTTFNNTNANQNGKKAQSKISLKRFLSSLSQNNHLMNTISIDPDVKLVDENQFRTVKQLSKPIQLKQNINKRKYHSHTNTVDFGYVANTTFNFYDSHVKKPVVRFNPERINRAESLKNENFFCVMVEKGKNQIYESRGRIACKQIENFEKGKVNVEIGQSLMFDEIQIQIKQIASNNSKLAFHQQHKDLQQNNSSSKFSNSHRLKSEQIDDITNYLKPQKSNNQMASRGSRNSVALSIQDVACIKTQSVGNSSESSDKFSQIVGTIKSIKKLVKKSSSSSHIFSKKKEKGVTEKQLKRKAILESQRAVSEA